MECAENKKYVTSVFINPEGKLIGTYRKRKPTHVGAVWSSFLVVDNWDYRKFCFEKERRFFSQQNFL